MLIKAGADVNMARINGYTALMFAAQKDHVEVVATLIKANADVNMARSDGVTALMIAAQNGHVKVVDKLKARSNSETALMSTTQSDPDETGCSIQ